MILYREKTDLPVKVGDTIHIRVTVDGFTATVAGWDVPSRTIWTWDNLTDVGHIHRARPWDTLWTSCEWRQE